MTFILILLCFPPMFLAGLLLALKGDNDESNSTDVLDVREDPEVLGSTST